MPRTRPVLGALAAAALLAAGCGGSSNDAKPAAKAPAAKPSKPAAAAPKSPTAVEPITTGAAPSRATYVRKADGVCREARKVSQQANTAVQKAFKNGKTVDAAAAIERFTPVFASKIHAIERMRRPERNTRVLQGLLRVMDAQVNALNAEAQALRLGNTQALQQIAQSQQQALQFADTLAKSYGFKVCGRAA